MKGPVRRPLNQRLVLNTAPLHWESITIQSLFCDSWDIFEDVINKIYLYLKGKLNVISYQMVKKCKVIFFMANLSKYDWIEKVNDSVHDESKCL